MLWLLHSSVYGHHMRLTKKDQPLLRKAANAKDYTTLTVQKTGLLFTSSELKRLSGKWDVASKNYEAAQDAIVAQAVEVARTYVATMQVRPDPSVHPIVVCVHRSMDPSLSPHAFMHSRARP